MKKLFSLLTLALLTMSAWAATEVTITFSDLYSANTMLEDVSPITVDGVTLSFAKDTGSTAPQYYTNGTNARIYAGNTMNVSAESAITNIAFTTSSGNYAWASSSVTVGAYADGVWAGNANSILFTNNTGHQVRIVSMVVTLAGDDPVVTVDAPVFSPAGQDFLTESLEVTLTCATEGAAIKYSTDGLTWQDYTQPIVITETTTIYAKAVLGDVESLVVNETYTKVDPVEVVTYALVTNVNDLAAGDKIIIASSGVAGSAYAMGASRGNNFGAVEVTVENNLTISTYDANVITLEANGNNWNLKTADGYLYAASSTQNQMKLENEVDTLGNANAAITIANDTTKIIFQGSNTRNHVRFNSSNNPVIFSCYAENSSVKNPVYIYKATTDIPEPPVEEVAAPVIEPNGGRFTGSVEVTITCETAGADIYYMINDGDEELYTGPFTLTETATVKAYADLDGVESNMTTATFTKRAEVATIAEANALPNKTYFVFTGNAVVVYQDVTSGNLWVKDQTGYGLIYGKQVEAVSEGATLNAGWDAQYYLFRGHINEYQYPNNVSASDAALQTITATEYTEAALDTTKINERVIVKGLTLTAGEDPKYLYTADGMAIYNQFGITYPTIEEGKTYDVEGMVSYYNNAVQIMPIAVTEVVDVPVYTRGDVNKDGSVNITDVTVLIDHLLTQNFTEADNFSPLAADCNEDEDINITDVTKLIDFLLQGNW